MLSFLNLIDFVVVGKEIILLIEKEKESTLKLTLEASGATTGAFKGGVGLLDEFKS